jgi:hypothetical protein
LTNALDGIELPDNIVDMNDLDETLNVLVYGDPGVGKTVFGGGADLIIATEKGLVSAKRQGSKAKAWPVSSWADVQAAYEWVEEKCAEGVLTTKHWISVDSAPEMQQLLLRSILDKAVALNDERDPDIPAIQDHQKWQNMFKRFIRLFNDLPVNVLYTATPMRVENEEGDPLVLPDFQGKGFGISSWVCAQMSAVGFMKKVGVRVKPKDSTKEPYVKQVRQIQWQATGEIFAKDRSDMCGENTRDKSLREIEVMMKTVPETLRGNGVARTPAKPSQAATVGEGPGKAARKAAPKPPAATAAPEEKNEVDISIDDDEN